MDVQTTGTIIDPEGLNSVLLIYIFIILVYFLVTSINY